jgi:hypothetical protein
MIDGKITYQQMLIGLDQLMFCSHISNQSEAETYAEVIETYLQQCGWSWDLILKEMSNEKLDIK